MKETKVDFAKSIRELEEINNWFQNEEIDLDEGLKKLRRGKELIRACRARLKDVEHEFTEIKQEFQEEKAVEKTSEEPVSPTDPVAGDQADDDIPF